MGSETVAKLPEDSWAISEEWGQFRQLEIFREQAHVAKSKSWSDWSWSADGRILRYNQDNHEEVEECEDSTYLESNLQALQEIRQDYLDRSLAAKNKSRARELMRGVKGKEDQIAWVQGKLRELEDRSDSSEISSSKIAHHPKLLEDKLDSTEISSSNQRRRKGEGSGCIYSRTVARNGKDYQQAYYQYEFWENGDRLIKSSKYIPKGKLAQVQKLNDEKAPVRGILKLLGVVR